MHIGNASGEKPEAEKSCQVPEVTFRFPITMGSSLPLIGTSEGAETSAKGVLRNNSPVGEGGAWSCICKDFTYKIEKISILHTRKCRFWMED